MVNRPHDVPPTWCTAPQVLPSHYDAWRAPDDVGPCCARKVQEGPRPWTRKIRLGGGR